MLVRLVRFAEAPFGTFGSLYVPGREHAFATVERPWKGNEPYKSCIPCGVYDIVLGTFRRNTDDPSDDYPCYEIPEVPGRWLIKMHRANFPEEVQGCIGIGMGYGGTEHRWMVTHSQQAHDEWMDAMGGAEEASLEITWGW